MNPYLILSGIGMLIVGILAPALWWWKKSVKIEFFILGLILWVVSVTPKFLMDLTLTNTLSTYFQSYGTVAYVAFMGLYVGLRTGILESGLSYIIIKRTRFRNANLNQAITAGISFGATEAVFIGFFSMMSTLIFILYPKIIENIPEAQRETVLKQINLSSLLIPAPILERAFALLIHVFAILLVFYAVKTKKTTYLWLSIFYKTIADGAIPAFNTFLDLTIPADAYMVETYFGILALVGLIGIEKLIEKWNKE